MKKTLCVFMLLAMLLCLFSGCDISSLEESTVPVSSQEEPLSENLDQTVTSEPSPTSIPVPITNYATDGIYYQDVMEQFVAAGFTNVTAVPYEAEALTDPNYEGYWVYVYIDGDPYFEDGAEYAPNAKVEVAYAVVPEATPTPEPTPEPTPQEAMVWIPQSGSKYHNNPDCSNMNNPSQVSISQAENMGYTPCKKCY